MEGFGKGFFTIVTLSGVGVLVFTGVFVAVRVAVGVEVAATKVIIPPLKGTGITVNCAFWLFPSIPISELFPAILTWYVPTAPFEKFADTM